MTNNEVYTEEEFVSDEGFKTSKHLTSVVAALVVIALSFIIGYYVGVNERSEIEKITALDNKTEGQPQAVDFAPFWRAWNVIEEKYVPLAGSNGNSTSSEEHTVATTQEKVWGSIQGLADSLEDPYTVFFPPQESKSFEEDISGEFQGVGIEIGLRDEVLTVISPLEGSPAKEAGVQSQDKIVEIDGDSTQGMSVEEAVKKIRGEGGTPVTFTIVREGESQPLTITVVRDDIQIPTLATKNRDDGIFVITLYNFSQQSPKEFRRAIREFANSGRNKLVLDLRQNPGGYLTAAVNMASYFLPEGEVVVREDFGDKREDTVYRSKGHMIDVPDLKMAVLVDGGSASASEILAGALSENGVATLVGTQTFGKGSVQQLVDITTDPKTSIKVTVARWLTPNGTSISLQGLTPEVEVERTIEDYRAGRDPQLDKAIELLTI